MGRELDPRGRTRAGAIRQFRHVRRPAISGRGRQRRPAQPDGLDAPAQRDAARQSHHMELSERRERASLLRQPARRDRLVRPHLEISFRSRRGQDQARSRAAQGLQARQASQSRQSRQGHQPDQCLENPATERQLQGARRASDAEAEGTDRAPRARAVLSGIDGAGFLRRQRRHRPRCDRNRPALDPGRCRSAIPRLCQAASRSDRRCCRPSPISH